MTAARSRRRRALGLEALCATLALSLVGCWGQRTAKSPTEPLGVRTLKSYRWITDLRAESLCSTRVKHRRPCAVRQLSSERTQKVTG